MSDTNDNETPKNEPTKPTEEVIKPKPQKGEVISQIQVTFPCPVELPPKWTHRLVDAVDEVCKLYVMQNPSRVMWPFGVGAKPRYIWESVADGEQEFDYSTLHIEVAEREDYKITEALSADNIRARASLMARRYWGYTNGGMASMFDMEQEILTLVNEAYAVGLEDGIGTEQALTIRKEMRDEQSVSTSPELLILMALARRQSLQKVEKTKAIIVQPGELAAVHPEDTITVGNGAGSELIIKYTSAKQQKGR